MLDLHFDIGQLFTAAQTGFEIAAQAGCDGQVDFAGIPPDDLLTRQFHQAAVGRVCLQVGQIGKPDDGQKLMHRVDDRGIAHRAIAQFLFLLQPDGNVLDQGDVDDPVAQAALAQ